MSDKKFLSIFITLMTFFGVLTVLLIVLAHAVSAESTEKKHLAVMQSLEERLQKSIYSVGQVVQSDESQAQSVEQFAATAVAATEPLSAAQVYEQNCALCHAAGVAGAPKIGDVTAWTERLMKGRNELYANAIGGINLMPAMGGNMKLSEDEVRAAVDYILESSR